MAEAIASKAPAIALRFNPWQSEALGKAAFIEWQRGGSRNATDADKLARRAIMVNPTAVEALRTLAYAAGVRGEMKSAERMIDQAQTISRRDALTQMWLIEREVEKGNIEGALTHYDIALKTAVKSRGILLPVLVGATVDRPILAPLAKFLAPRPVWRQDFVQALLVQPPDPSNAAELSLMLDRLGAPLEQAEKVTIGNYLIGERKYALAARLMQRERQRGLVFNEHFQGGDDGNPFGWRLKADTDLGAVIGQEQGAPALRIYAAHERSGDVAQQLLMLPAGAYRLTTILEGTPPSPGALPYWTLTCAGGAQIASVDLPMPARRSASSARVSVPADCQAQWLVLHLRAASGEGTDLLVRRVSIASAG